MLTKNSNLVNTLLVILIYGNDIMSQVDQTMIGKPVKDMYGASMGKVLGTTTEIDGTIQSVGINCGSEGLKQIPFVQLVVQPDVVIFIPKWRLDAQKMIREKELTIRKLSALMQIIAENNNMQGDAEMIHQKYKTKWNALQETEFTIKSQLENRITEITAQEQSIKILLFDAKVQAKSNEITQDTFNSVQHETDEMLQHMEHEKVEIEKVQEKIDNMTLDSSCSNISGQIDDNASGNSETHQEEIPESNLPEPPTMETNSEHSNQTSVMAHGNSEEDVESSDWINRMQSN